MCIRDSFSISLLKIYDIKHPDVTHQNTRIFYIRTSGCYLLKHPEDVYKRQPALYGRVQAVLDYISGMTDVFALDLYRKINGNSLPAV